MTLLLAIVVNIFLPSYESYIPDTDCENITSVKCIEKEFLVRELSTTKYFVSIRFSKRDLLDKIVDIYIYIEGSFVLVEDVVFLALQMATAILLPS